MATAIPTACLASSAIRCRDVETGPNRGVLAVFPSTGATCRCPLPSTGSRGLNSPASAVSGRRRRPSKGSPPSAAQTVRETLPTPRRGIEPIPPRFWVVACARRYHPSTCGRSLRRTPGATSTASGDGEPVPHLWRPGGLYDGDDEASRVPGKPTRTHASDALRPRHLRFAPSEGARPRLHGLLRETRRDATFRPTHDVGPRTPCMSGLNHAAYGLPVNASRPGSPQAHASLGSGWRPTLAGWDWIPTGCRTRFQRSHHGILSPLTGLSRHTRWCTNRHGPARCAPTGSSPADSI